MDDFIFDATLDESDFDLSDVTGPPGPSAQAVMEGAEGDSPGPSGHSNLAIAISNSLKLTL